MKKVHRILNQRAATKTAGFMKAVCYIIMLFFALSLTLAFCGRLEYVLRVEGKTYERAIYAEENHNYTSRAFTVGSNDRINMATTSADEKIDLVSYIALVVMHSINIIPLMFAYWFLSKVFSNVAKGEIFVEKNAHYLLYYGLIQACVAVFVPFAKLLIIQVANALTTDHISIATGTNMINQLIPSIAFFVAAYIINYGVHLQDEVDHTL